jgi:hypothetical protein
VHGTANVDVCRHLVDRILPDRGVRQWPLTLPIRLRCRCALEKEFLGKVLGIWLRPRSIHRRLAFHDAWPGPAADPQLFGNTSRALACGENCVR